MAQLLVDIGNTRIKWARLSGTRWGKPKAAVHASWHAGDYRRRVFRGARPERVLVASVAGAQVNKAFASVARSAGARAEFVTVPRRGGGISVGYLDTWRLGVDRFAACVAAHDLFKDLPVCVVGVGTAMTIDLVDGRGAHQGGVIIPSPGLMVDTLLTQTHGIRRRAQGAAGKGTGIFRRSTREAIVHGARHAAAALIDRAVGQAQASLKRRPLVVMFGGEAAAVRPLLSSPCVGVPDLVLRGLAVLARTPPVRR
jgi:type III pantothenate kinase